MGNVSSSTSNIFPDSAPDWKPDNCTEECLVCCKSFNVIIRRHHCRACGDVICNNCFTKDKNKKCDLRIYGYMDPQFVCTQCLKLLDDENCFKNKLKENKKFGKYEFNQIQSINPSIYNHIHRGFNQYHHEFNQMSSDKYFAILIPYQFEQYTKNTKETIDIEGIEKYFDFYYLWKTKKVKFENKLIDPNTIQLLYTITKEKGYINKCDNFIFLTSNIYCYGVEKDLFIVPKMISVKLKKITKEILKEYKQRNLKRNPFTKHDIFNLIKIKMKDVYDIQEELDEEFEKILSIKDAITFMQNANYHQNIQKYDKSQQQFKSAYDAFIDYKHQKINDDINVDQYIKLMQNQHEMSMIDVELTNQNISNDSEIKCAFCRLDFEPSFNCNKLTYCHHQYCKTCCIAIVILWTRFDLYPICIVDGCFAKCKDRMLFDLPQHIQNRLYLIQQTKLCSTSSYHHNIDNNDYYQFILNTLNALDNKLWQSMESKLMQQTNEINQNLMKILKKVCLTELEFHEDFMDCNTMNNNNNNQYQDDRFMEWKARYLFEIGALINEKEFRNKFICLCQCKLRYSLNDIQFFMNNFQKEYGNIYQKILISTICDSYQEFNQYQNRISSQLLDLFVTNLFSQLNIDHSTRIVMSAKIKMVLNTQIEHVLNGNNNTKQQPKSNGYGWSISSHRARGSIESNPVYCKNEQCNINSKECRIVAKLVTTYKQENDINNADYNQFVELYDAWFHCLLHHDKTEIYQLLNDKHECENKCKIYQRYNQNKYVIPKKQGSGFEGKYDDDDDKENDNDSDEINGYDSYENDSEMQMILKTRLMDKIHCYYFDITKMLSKHSVSSTFVLYKYGQEFKSNYVNEANNPPLIAFKSLKEEIMNEDFEWSLSEEQWNILMAESKLIYDTMHAKNSYYVVMDENNDQYFDSISLMEIVAIKLYTDYPLLTEKMGRCFTSQNTYNQRKKYYAHWNKLLSIACNHGSMSFKFKNKTKNLFQIVEGNTIIPSFNDKYAGPLALSSDKNGKNMETNDNNKNVILEIKLNQQNGKYTKTKWLTHYPHCNDLLCYDQQIQISNVYESVNINKKCIIDEEKEVDMKEDGLIKYLDILSNITSQQKVLDLRSNSYIKHKSYKQELDDDDDASSTDTLPTNKELNKNEWNILKRIWNNYYINKHDDDNKNNDKDNNNKAMSKYILKVFEYEITNCEELWIDDNLFEYIDCMNWNDIQVICKNFKSLQRLFLCNKYKLTVKFLTSLTEIIDNNDDDKYLLECITIESGDDSFDCSLMQKEILQSMQKFENNLKFKNWTITYQQQSFNSSDENKRLYQIKKKQSR